MKQKLIYSLALTTLLLGSCKKEIDASSKIDEAKVTATEEKIAQLGKLPIITFAEEEFDFGTITEGDTVEHIFPFTNTGEAELFIVDVKPSCGCTVPEYTKTPVAPGASGEIKVIFNSAGKPGEQSKSVRVITNTEAGEYSLNFKASVTPKK